MRLHFLFAILALACTPAPQPPTASPQTVQTSGASSPPIATVAPPTESSSEIVEGPTGQQYGTASEPSASLDAPEPALSTEVPGDALREQVRAALSSSHVAETVAIHINGTNVFLGGYVTSERQRAAARDAAMAVPGVDEVFTHALRVRS